MNMSDLIALDIGRRTIQRATAPDAPGVLPWLCCERQILSAGELRGLSDEMLNEYFGKAPKTGITAHNQIWSHRGYYRFDDERATWIVTTPDTQEMGDALILFYPPRQNNSRLIDIVWWEGERQSMLDLLAWLSGQTLPIHKGARRVMEWRPMLTFVETLTPQPFNLETGNHEY